MSTTCIIPMPHKREAKGSLKHGGGRVEADSLLFDLDQNGWMAGS